MGKNRHHGSWRRRLARYSKKREQDVLADMAARDDLLSSEVQFRILEDDSWTTESYLPVFYDTVPGILNTINTSTRRPG